MVKDPFLDNNSLYTSMVKDAYLDKSSLNKKQTLVRDLFLDSSNVLFPDYVASFGMKLARLGSS